MSLSHETVRSRVDPESRLPTISATTTYYEGLDFDATSYTLRYQDIRIGHMTVHDSGEDVQCFQGVSVDTRFRGKGFGLAAYVLAIEAAHSAGRNFETDDLVSQYAIKIWNQLQLAGVAEVIRPFEFSFTDTDYDVTYYDGLYRVTRPNATTCSG